MFFSTVLMKSVMYRICSAMENTVCIYARDIQDLIVYSTFQLCELLTMISCIV